MKLKVSDFKNKVQKIGAKIGLFVLTDERKEIGTSFWYHQKGLTKSYNAALKFC